jgi:hypothetical protein
MKGTMRWYIILLAVALWQARPETAEACSCGLGAGYPADGDTDVPTDAELAFPSVDGLAPILRTTDGTEVPTRVRSATGIVLSATWFLVAPLEELAPETEYELVSVSAIRFKTGKSRTREMPQATDVLDLFLAHTSDLALCDAQLCFNSDEQNTTSMSYRPSPGAVYYELAITIDGETWSRLVPATFGGWLGGFCVGGPSYTDGQTVCAELVAIAANGARAASGQIACTEVISCEVTDCDLEELRDCHQTNFAPGPVAAPPPDDGDSGCSTTGKGNATTAFLLLLLLLGTRTKVPSLAVADRIP